MQAVWRRLRRLAARSGGRMRQPQENAEMLRSVVDTVIDGIVIIDARGTIHSFNPAAERLFGYDAKEVIGRNVNVLMPEPYHGGHDAYLRNYLTTGEARVIGIGREVVGLRKDGSTFEMELSVSEFQLGRDRYFTGVVRDVTSRKELEADLRARLQQVAEAEQRMRSVVDNVVDGIITIDEAAVIRTFNPAAERIFGYRREEVTGRNVAMLMPEPDRTRHDGYVAHYLATGEARIIGTGREVVGQRRDGTLFPMELAISEFRIGAARYFTGIVRDITERKRLEHELHQKLEQLALSDRRKDQFIGLLGHELRNPLAPVRNGLQILRLSSADGDRIRTILEMMDRQIGHMVRLIDDLLDISRITSGKIALRRDNVDLRDVVRQAVEAAAPVFEGKSQPLHASLPDAPVIVYVDPVRIAQVVSNLLDNASKFSEQGQATELALGRDGEYATLVVSDEGAGVPHDKLEEIFEIFVQADPGVERRRSGLGIGLTLVRSLVDLHGGTVTAHSEGPGRGARFEVKLPALAARRAPERPATAPAPADACSAARRILVIDDNRDAADTTSALLRMLGHEVTTVYDGRSGLEETARLLPDVVLCDIAMPGMSGYEVARAIRALELARSMTLIALTGYGQPEAVRDARAAGFDFHLVKPADLNVLSSLVRAAPAAH